MGKSLFVKAYYNGQYTTSKDVPSKLKIEFLPGWYSSFANAPEHHDLALQPTKFLNFLARTWAQKPPQDFEQYPELKDFTTDPKSGYASLKFETVSFNDASMVINYSMLADGKTDIGREKISVTEKITVSISDFRTSQDKTFKRKNLTTEVDLPHRYDYFSNQEMTEAVNPRSHYSYNLEDTYCLLAAANGLISFDLGNSKQCSWDFEIGIDGRFSKDSSSLQMGVVSALAHYWYKYADALKFKETPSELGEALFNEAFRITVLNLAPRDADSVEISLRLDNFYNHSSMTSTFKAENKYFIGLEDGSIAGLTKDGKTIKLDGLFKLPTTNLINQAAIASDEDQTQLSLLPALLATHNATAKRLRALQKHFADSEKSVQEFYAQVTQNAELNAVIDACSPGFTSELNQVLQFYRDKTQEVDISALKVSDYRKIIETRGVSAAKAQNSEKFKTSYLIEQQVDKERRLLEKFSAATQQLRELEDIEKEASQLKQVISNLQEEIVGSAQLVEELEQKQKELVAKHAADNKTYQDAKQENAAQQEQITNEINEFNQANKLEDQAKFQSLNNTVVDLKAKLTAANSELGIAKANAQQVLEKFNESNESFTNLSNRLVNLDTLYEKSLWV